MNRIVRVKNLFSVFEYNNSQKRKFTVGKIFNSHKIWTNNLTGLKIVSHKILIE